jgi:sphingomyelin phosphodiesterase acid-like 3
VTNATTVSVRALRSIALAALLSAACGFPAERASAADTPWLAISDVHYDPANERERPSSFGTDTNDALLTSMLGEAHAVDPNPPVVIIAGDFLAHQFRRADAESTMTALAARFNATFPNAQFVITLGNNDSSCGDYLAPIGGPFLASIAKAWAPLVDRAGAAPDFASRFARDGTYVARLPEPGLRIVVSNDVFESLRFGPSCAQGDDGAAETLGRLRADLRAAGPHDRNWVLFHIPPGIDAYTTTHLTHRLGIVPFLRPRAREALESDLVDPRDRVVLVIAGHTHKFGYRIIPGQGGVLVPTLLVPSVSPIFNNGPSFLELAVEPDSTISNVVEYSYDDGTWKRLGALADLGVERFTAPDLEALQKRLAHDPSLRTKFSRLYSGAGRPEIDESNWRSYWCASTNFSATSFDACTGSHGLSILTGRALKLVAAAAGILLLIALLALFFFRPKSRPAKA